MAPLLVWLLSKDVGDATKLISPFRSLNHGMRSGGSIVNVWNMLQLEAFFAPVDDVAPTFTSPRLYTMSPEFYNGRNREDTDVLVQTGLVSEFMHCLTERLKHPSLRARDAVLLSGNLMLGKRVFDRLKALFHIRLLCIDPAKPETLGACLGHDIELLTDVTGKGLRDWMSDALAQHLTDMHVDPVISQDPFMSTSLQSVQSMRFDLFAPHYSVDKPLVEACLVKIEPLRNGLVETELSDIRAKRLREEEEDDEPSNDGETYIGRKRVRRAEPHPLPALTAGDIQEWARKNLVVEKQSKVLFTEVKNKLTVDLRARFTIPGNTTLVKMMEAADVMERRSNGRKGCGNSEKEPLGWRQPV
jgi:hypothetical protein